MCVGLRAVAADAVPQPVGPSGMWVGFFHDEFDADRLDSRVWRANRSGGTGVDGPFNPSSEAAAFDPANVSLLGGTLRLVVTAQPATIADRRYPFRSGAISSQGTVRLRDGDYVEARIRVPRGEGLWPAFWACTENGWPPEIDGFEFFDTARQSTPRFNYHYPAGGQSGPRGYGEASVDYRDSWHKYGWLRRNGTLIPYVDGVAYPAAGATGVDRREYFMIVNLSVYAGRNPLVGSSPVQMEVDWIRAWRPAGSATSGPTSPSSSSPSSSSPSSSSPSSSSPSSSSPSASTSGVVPIGSTQAHSAIRVVAAKLRRPAGTVTSDWQSARSR
jgi:beta-glucanase (GH16 family)